MGGLQCTCTMARLIGFITISLGKDGARDTDNTYKQFDNRKLVHIMSSQLIVIIYCLQGNVYKINMILINNNIP